jgi:hypothetical protein
VTHIDDHSIALLTDFYREELATVVLWKNGDVSLLDLFSSWISHLHMPHPKEDDIVPFGRIVGVGMNEDELAANEQLTEY